MIFPQMCKGMHHILKTQITGRLARTNTWLLQTLVGSEIPIQCWRGESVVLRPMKIVPNPGSGPYKVAKQLWDNSHRNECNVIYYSARFCWLSSSVEVAVKAQDWYLVRETFNPHAYQPLFRKKFRKQLVMDILDCLWRLGVNELHPSWGERKVSVQGSPSCKGQDPSSPEASAILSWWWSMAQGPNGHQRPLRGLYRELDYL